MLYLIHRRAPVVPAVERERKELLSGLAGGDFDVPWGIAREAFCFGPCRAGNLVDETSVGVVVHHDVGCFPDGERCRVDLAVALDVGEDDAELAGLLVENELGEVDPDFSVLVGVGRGQGDEARSAGPADVVEVRDLGDRLDLSGAEGLDPVGGAAEFPQGLRLAFRRRGTLVGHRAFGSARRRRLRRLGVGQRPEGLLERGCAGRRDCLGLVEAGDEPVRRDGTGGEEHQDGDGDADDGSDALALGLDLRVLVRRVGGLLLLVTH